MANTIFADKLKNTAVGQQSKLYMTAVAALRHHNGNVFQAQRTIASKVQFDLQQIRELCGDELRELIERKALAYARKIQQDQSGDALWNEAGRHSIAASQSGCASASFHQPIWTPEDIKPSVEQNREQQGQIRIANGPHLDAQRARGPVDGDGGQPMRAADGPIHRAPSPSPESAGGLPRSANSQRSLASPLTPSVAANSPVPNGQNSIAPTSRFQPGNARRGATTIAAVQSTMAKSLLDTYQIRNGIVIGDILLKELPDLVATNRKEAFILERIKNHTANGAPSQQVREIISETSLQAYIEEAEARHAAG